MALIEIRLIEEPNKVIVIDDQDQDATNFYLPGNAPHYKYCYPKALWELVPSGQWEDVTVNITLEKGQLRWGGRYIAPELWENGTFRFTNSGTAITIERLVRSR